MDETKMIFTDDELEFLKYIEGSNKQTLSATLLKKLMFLARISPEPIQITYEYWGHDPSGLFNLPVFKKVMFTVDPVTRNTVSEEVIE